ncbi:MAG: 2-phospho-L-lactate guanylyltransferase [Anaerolineaceae bacterium]|nr:2-phospho-L-lactate guanylyltransferase [Anaerolineaceae bacterium]
MGLWAIVPVKPLRRGKSRLAGVLSEEERTYLNYTMLANTLKILAAVKEIDTVLVISRDTSALALARDFNAHTVQEDGSSDLNIAIQRAAVVAMFSAAESILILPADLLLITPEIIQGFIQRKGKAPALVIAPDRRMDGTNAMLISPPDLLNYSYGLGSFTHHVEQALQAHASVEICRIPELALDLDLPEDLDLLREMDGAGIHY